MSGLTHEQMQQFRDQGFLVIKGLLDPVADLDPVKIWTAAEDRATRTWQRGVKYYESLRLVYEIESRVKEWRDDGSDAASNQAAAPSAPASK